MKIAPQKIVALTALIALQSACSVFNVSSSTYYRDAEGRFSYKIIESITPQETSNTWLKQQFGTPMWVDQADHQVEIATWQFVREQHKRKDLVLLVRYRTVKEDAEYLHVVFQNDVVVKWWKDRHELVDVKRVIYALGLEQAPKQAMQEQKDMEPSTLVHMSPDRSGVGEHKSSIENANAHPVNQNSAATMAAEPMMYEQYAPEPVTVDQNAMASASMPPAATSPAIPASVMSSPKMDTMSPAESESVRDMGEPTPSQDADLLYGL